MKYYREKERSVWERGFSFFLSFIQTDVIHNFGHDVSVHNKEKSVRCMLFFIMNTLQRSHLKCTVN